MLDDVRDARKVDGQKYDTAEPLGVITDPLIIYCCATLLGIRSFSADGYCVQIETRVQIFLSFSLAAIFSYTTANPTAKRNMIDCVYF